jgi:hypothetical protein
MPGLKPTASDKPQGATVTFIHKHTYINTYINNGAHYRVWNHVNSGLSLAVGSTPGILCSLRMVRLYRNM